MSKKLLKLLNHFQILIRVEGLVIRLDWAFPVVLALLYQFGR